MNQILICLLTLRTHQDIRSFCLIFTISSLVFLSLGGCVSDAHSDYVTPSFTYSPDGRLGVMLPVFRIDSEGESDPRLNKVVDVASHRVAATIQAEPGYDKRLNFREVVAPKWSSDSSILIWEVDGKWFPYALVLLKFHEGNQQWQLDLLKTGQQQILSRTRKAVPERYAAAKKANVGSGSAYPEGFTIDVTTDSEDSTAASLPLNVRVTLTANPKQIEGFTADLNASLDATVTEKGEFVVKTFLVEEQ